MSALTGLAYAFWAVFLAGLGIALILGARTHEEMGTRALGNNSDVRWWTLIKWWWFGLTLVFAGALVVLLGLQHFDAIDDCLDAGGRWLEVMRSCEGAR